MKYWNALGRLHYLVVFLYYKIFFLFSFENVLEKRTTVSMTANDES